MSVLQRPLFSLVRGGFEEVRICGEIAVHDGTETIFDTGQAGTYPVRSLLKPFQFAATRENPSASEDWTQIPRYAPALGSISATREQVAQLRTWYPESPVTAGIKFPPSFPMDETHRVLLKLEGRGPERIYHTCFSKHAAILEACLREKWPTENYLSLEHPYHRRLATSLQNLLGSAAARLTLVTDGCLLPTPVLELEAMATLYARLAKADPRSALGGARSVMLSHPEWVGGPGRIDTKLMTKNAGQMIAKEGADGLWGISVMPNSLFPDGLGICLKLASGYQPVYAAIALGRLLEWAGLQPIHECPKGHELVYHYQVLGTQRR